MWSERRSVEYITGLVKSIDNRTTAISTQLGGFEEAIGTLKLNDNKFCDELQRLDQKQDDLALTMAHGRGLFTGIAIVVSFAVSILVSLYVKGG